MPEAVNLEPLGSLAVALDMAVRQLRRSVRILKKAQALQDRALKLLNACPPKEEDDA